MTSSPDTTAPADTAPTGRPQPFAAVDSTTYNDVLHFYAWQTQLLDDGHAEAWAATFTEDAVFAQATRPGRVFSGGSPAERRGRDVIAASARAGVARHAAQKLVRRHWIGQVAVRPGAEPDTVETRFYALIVETAAGERPSVHLSTTGTDVLVRDGHGWLIRERWITHDDALHAA